MPATPHQRVDFVIRDQIVIAIGIRTELVSSADPLFPPSFTFLLNPWLGIWLHAKWGGTPDSRALRHCGQSFSLLGFNTRGVGALLDFFLLVNHFMTDLDWIIICEHKTITVIKNIINEG
jgi:hypothetical protein